MSRRHRVCEIVEAARPGDRASRRFDLFSLSLIFLDVIAVILWSVPDKFSSILARMWQAVATLTTIGYGDVVPVTMLGKLVGALIAALGIAFFALPTAIPGSGFVDAVREQKVPRTCPHCGEPVE